ncbi:MAG: tRNA pseudouridine(38-40) synthase TruA [Erysipelotrichaceae bacterium]|nr:tRNA pseudouridine(38-40) synthase TruA [Erysipelotrichaceae bacterium]
MRYKVTVAYDGRAYVGFQSQINGLAIQDVIEKGLRKIFNQDDLRIVMASRTDKGVHARDQVFHFDHEKVIEPARLKMAINTFMPNDIHILKVEHVDSSFHARYLVKNKTYEYLVNLGEYDVFLNGYAYQCYYKLDIEKMIEASKLFLGTHDFTSFNTSPKDLYPNQVRTIYEFEIRKDGDRLTFHIKGDGFLRHMVRIIVGTLIELGRGKKNISDVKEMFDHPTKSKRRYNIDGAGLYLMKIEY